MPPPRRCRCCLLQKEWGYFPNMENSFSIDLGEPLSHGIRVIDEIASLLSRKLHPCAKMMFTHQFFFSPLFFSFPRSTFLQDPLASQSCIQTSFMIFFCCFFFLNALMRKIQKKYSLRHEAAATYTQSISKRSMYLQLLLKNLPLSGIWRLHSNSIV